MKIVELENVYLEIPEVLENDSSDEELIITESRTTKLSLDELQRKLEETQALHL